MLLNMGIILSLLLLFRFTLMFAVVFSISQIFVPLWIIVYYIVQWCMQTYAYFPYYFIIHLFHATSEVHLLIIQLLRSDFSLLFLSLYHPWRSVWHQRTHITRTTFALATFLFISFGISSLFSSFVSQYFNLVPKKKNILLKALSFDPSANL